MSSTKAVDSSAEFTADSSIILPSDQTESYSFQISLRTSELPSSIQNEPEADYVENVDPEPSVKEDIILCILWNSGKLGAAYYNPSDSELYVIPDIVDLGPEYIMTRTLYEQIKPSHTLTIGTMASKFVIALASISCYEEIKESDASSWYESIRTLPPHIQLLKTDEYSYDRCIHAIETLQLPSEPEDATEAERIIYIHSLVHFNRYVSTHALGALVLFLSKYRGLIQTTNATRSHLFQNINTVPIQDIVLMDEETFRTLQIFNAIAHPAAYKRGKGSTYKEGVSIYKLFNRCKSTFGRIDLRSTLLHPTSNLEVLQKRQQFIEFCLKPINSGIVTGIQECLKYVYPILGSLAKIYGSQANLNNWKVLYSTLHNVLLIQQLCEPYLDEVAYFREYDDLIDDYVYAIMQTILETIDFDNSVKNRVSIRPGVDEELDAKKRFRSEIKEKINAAAAFEIHNLPDHIQDCSIVYIPQIGYLVAVKKWADDADYRDIEEYGFRHMFTLGNLFNFKSAVCDELDKCLGDIYTEIQEHETRIIIRLSESVLAHSAAIKRPLKFIGHMDSLICMAEVAKDFGYVKPNIVQENMIDIKDGRHPLLEILNPHFVPNSMVSGGHHTSVKIITGPNNSGKSIYLKQVALIVYLTHIGSYVPAASATIGLTYSIHCSRSTSLTESASVKISTFAVDLRQICQAMHCSEKNSLILIDEFGRATTELDGLALLAAYLEQFLFREEYCPHILVSTHYLHLTNLIPESKYVAHLKCDYKTIEDKLVFLYKIVKGTSASYAIHAALNAGLPPKILERSKEIFRCLTEGIDITAIQDEEDEEENESSISSSSS